MFYSIYNNSYFFHVHRKHITIKWRHDLWILGYFAKKEKKIMIARAMSLASDDVVRNLHGCKFNNFFLFFSSWDMLELCIVTVDVRRFIESAHAVIVIMYKAIISHPSIYFFVRRKIFINNLFFHFYYNWCCRLPRTSRLSNEAEAFVCWASFWGSL